MAQLAGVSVDYYVRLELAANTVAGFRLLYAAQPDDRRLREVLARLQEEAPEFPDMWADHLALGRRLTSKRFRHPLVGDLELQIHAFDVRASAGQELVVYRALPGTPDAASLDELRTIAGS